MEFPLTSRNFDAEKEYHEINERQFVLTIRSFVFISQRAMDFGAVPVDPRLGSTTCAKPQEQLSTARDYSRFSGDLHNKIYIRPQAMPVTGLHLVFRMFVLNRIPRPIAAQMAGRTMAQGHCGARPVGLK